MTEIKRLRLQQGKNVPAISRASDCYPNEIYRAERGESKIHPKLRRGIAQALNVPEESLFDSAGWPHQAVESELAASA